MNHRKSTTSPRTLTPRGITAIVAGALAVPLGFSLSLAAGMAFSQHDGESADIGSGDYSGDGYTIVSAPFDWSSERYLGSSIEQVTFDVSAESADAPIFVGLADPDDVEQYLADSEAHTDNRYRFEYTERTGTPPGTDPREIDIWTAQSEGRGATTLEFLAPDQDGDRVLVLMNAEGEPLGPVTVDSRAVVPSANALVGGLLAVGVLAMVGGTVLIVRPISRARRAPKGERNA